MGAFDDLIPQQAGAAPASPRGMFDDLIPQQPVTQPAPTGALGAALGARDALGGGALAAAVQARDTGISTPAAPQQSLVERVITAPTRLANEYIVDPIVEAVTGSKEMADLRQANPNAPTQGGVPISQRMYASFLNTPAARDLYLSRTYGPEGQGWYRLTDAFGKPTNRVVVRSPDGKERLFNPPGVDTGDVAEMAGGVPDFLGGVAGGLASVPAYVAGPGVGLAASATGSATGAQLAGETFGRFFPENRQAEPDIIKQVLPRAAKEGALDAVTGLATGGAAKLGVGLANKARAPFAESASDPMATAFRGAADRLKTQGYDIAPLPSEGGAGGFVPRMEGFLSKLPGSAEKMRSYREGGDQAITRFQQNVAGNVDPAEVGRGAVSELSTQRKNLIIDREQSLSAADSMIAGNEASLAARQGPMVGAEAAGQQVRAGFDNARAQFQQEAKRLYDAARAAPGGQDAIVDMTPVRDQVKAIRGALPPSAEGQPNGAFTPDGLSRFLQGVDDTAPSMTLDQARQMRTMVYDAMDDKTIMPGVPERFLSQLGRSLTGAIDGSVDRVADPQLKTALQAANSYYRDNVDKFSRRGVGELARAPTQAGFVEDNQVVSRLLSGAGKPGVIRDLKRTLGENSPEWAAARRQALEQVLDTGRNQTLYGRQVVNVDGLVGRLNSLDDEAVKELFGVNDAKQLRNLAADISNRTKYLDASALSPEGTGNIIGQLRAAAVADQQIASDYRQNVIAPFLRGEDGAAAKMKAEELVPFLYRKAAPDEIKNVVGRLPPAIRQDVERAAVADIIENAIAKGRGDIDSVRRLVTNQSTPASGEGIAEVLGAGGDTAGRLQRARIDALLTPESKQALQDLALITARRQANDATTNAIGGLAAGAAVTNLLTNPMSGFQAAAVSRGLAQMVTSPAFRAWVTNTKQFRPSVGTLSQTPNAGETLADIMSGAAAENSDVEAAMNWLKQGASQIDQQGRRTLRPPDGKVNWQEYFSGGAR